MKGRVLVWTLAALAGLLPALSTAATGDAERDILVTFDNREAGSVRTGGSAPYRLRKRYAIAASVRRHARAVEKQYGLARVDQWPIDSLSVYCFVYRVSNPEAREATIARLRADTRVESVQALHTFQTGVGPDPGYDDTYATLQHGLSALDIRAAHRHSQGEGIRIAMIDSDADVDHEDLRGQVSKLVVLTDPSQRRSAEHGTAVAGIISATANNALGIVGVAPKSELEVFVSCWQNDGHTTAICDSFTLAKALDTVLGDPPDILNLSLTGPDDALVERLLAEVVGAGVIVFAAEAREPTARNRFPASLHDINGVASTIPETASDDGLPSRKLHAPGNGILVTLPDDNYELRSGSSLATAHASGVAALLLAVMPDASPADVRALLHQSQYRAMSSGQSINACRALQLADAHFDCAAPEPAFMIR